MVRTRIVWAALAALAVAGAVTLPSASAHEDSAAGVHRPKGPTVIGHRGASGYRPEHTLGAYELAARMGADYVEPDLVSTKDGQLVARHENEIGGTTDVSAKPEFAGRKTTKVIDGASITGWFTEDFTLAELKTLRATERIPDVRPRNTLYNGRYEIPTLQEVVDLSRRLSRELGRDIGIYPETKHPTYFQEIELPLEQKLVDVLNRNGLNRPGAKVYVQSFEVANLKALKKKLRVPLVQLVNSSGAPYDFVKAGDKRTYRDLVTPAGLREIRTYASGIGAAKDLIIPRNAQGSLLAPTTLVKDAHVRGLIVHSWTFRNENAFLPADLRSSTDPAAYGRAFEEYAKFYATGLDGVFADNPDTAVEARSSR
ncbi:glycerophosphodiester phosphodiesterase [Actinosynnema sp. NPDC047251]|uniref:glycerophosphodiester phosphodiesterase n=1 Tax=Saccharothrix espanaensis (strain ATCC 51144 / DSM 44229 / JCM 9112 / NBRC 15066 / NRRL 15764) TaxID=1179773 RepID=K0K5F4_SACES|nr:glycerophosphodiester phosphodiesterase [Saccharothrix espanaensis]CCH35505.1 Glycerophosphoryl diester phosphodiesterase [Saccharothrix espanaensis DSM 44229]